MDISSIRIPFPDLDCGHWMDAAEPEDNDAVVVEALEDQPAPVTSEAA